MQNRSKPISYVFVARNKEMSELIAALKASGMSDKNIEAKGNGYLIKTDGTILRAEIVENRYPGDDMHFYSLFYKDIKLCETRDKTALWDSRTHSFNYNLDKLPKSILIEEEKLQVSSSIKLG